MEMIVLMYSIELQGKGIIVEEVKSSLYNE